MNKELLPCPFCGVDNLGTSNPHDGYIATECQGCGATGPITYNDDQESKWNTRATTPGFKLVPVVATDEQLDAMSDNCDDTRWLHVMYRDAIKAAP